MDELVKIIKEMVKASNTVNMYVKDEKVVKSELGYHDVKIEVSRPYKLTHEATQLHISKDFTEEKEE